MQPLHKPRSAVVVSRLTGWRRILPFALERDDRDSVLRILWTELAAWAVAAALLAYGMSVTGAWLFLRYERGVRELAFVDLLVPSRRSEYRHVLGEHYIALGREQLAAGHPVEACRSLTSGVAKSPASISGRVLLAQLLSSAGRSHRAAETLLAGLQFARDDPAYLQALFTFLLEQQDDSTVRRVARELLADPRLPRECASLAALAAASACYFRGNYDQAEDLLNARGLSATAEGRLLAAQIDWDRGYRDLALLQLRSLSDEFPHHAAIRLQVGEWLRLSGRKNEFRRLCVIGQLVDPQDPGPRIDFLHALRDDSEAERLDREITSILRDFSRDEKTLVALADFAANTGNPALARRIYVHCKSTGLAWQAPAFLMIEALMVARDYRGSIDLVRQLLDENPDWSGAYRDLLDSLQAVAHYGLGDPDTGRLYLTNFLGRPNLRAENLLAVAQRLVETGARAEACETLAHAVTADPLNQAAITRLVELDLDLDRTDSLPTHLRRLLTMRKPSPVVLRAAAFKLGSDLYLFSRDRDATLAALDHALAVSSR